MKYDVKIKNKTKDGCLIKSLDTGRELKMTWTEFNSQFDLVDLYYGNLKEEIKKTFKEVRGLASMAAVYQLKAKNSPSSAEKMKAYGMLSVIFEKIQKLTNWSNIEVLQFIKKYIDASNELCNMSQEDFNKLSNEVIDE